MTGSGGRDDVRGTRVGFADVRRLEDVVAELRGLDYRYGGGACRTAVESRLPAAVALLDGVTKTVVLARLCTAVADLYNLAGWTNFDQDRPAAALEAFGRALELAVEAGNDDLQANVRYRIGRLHLHYGAVDAALAEFARGREAALLAHSKLAQAILSANQAWAHAKKADVTEALTYLRRARQEFAEAEGREPSPWDAFFGPTDMAAMVGTVHGELAQVVDIRHGRDGIPALTEAIAGYRDGGGMTRSRSLTLIWLATVHALDGDLDVATAVGEEAIELAGALRSPRTRQRLHSLSAAARRFSGNADAQEIVDRVDDLGQSGR
ncbi:tetratricopeptide repeat protein [Amycolatopsis sp. NPDC003865]